MWAKEETAFILEIEDGLKKTKQTIQSVPGGAYQDVRGSCGKMNTLCHLLPKFRLVKQ